MDAVLLVSQGPNGALSARRFPAGRSCFNPSTKLRRPFIYDARLMSNAPNFGKSLHLTQATVGQRGSSGQMPAPQFPTQEDKTVSVEEAGVPLEGVIQLDKPYVTPSLISWAMVALLAGGDVLCLLVFAAVGRFSHGLSIADFETFKTADPFIAGWVLSAYFLGGYGDDGKGLNGYGKSLAASARSWLVGIPLGIAIRAALSGHIPQMTFVLVTMGSTGILLVGWRALASKFLISKSSKNDVYKHGNPFELFELLTSLIRRW